MRISVSSDRRPEDADGTDRANGVPGDDDAAATRSLLTSYFAAFGEAPEHVAGLAEGLTARAAQRRRLRPDRDLAELALEEAGHEVTAWALFVLGRERVDAECAALVARAAYRACGGAVRWPGVLLRYDPPVGFVDEMRSAAPPPTPPERRGRMVTQPLETWSPLSAATPRLVNRLINVFANASRI